MKNKDKQEATKKKKGPLKTIKPIQKYIKTQICQGPGMGGGFGIWPYRYKLKRGMKGPFKGI